MYSPPSFRFHLTGNLDLITMGHNLETLQYRMSMLCALRRVSVYSRSYIVQWELLQLGLASLGTALALYYLIVCLSLLVVQDTLLSTLVLVMVCTCLSVILRPWMVGFCDNTISEFLCPSHLWNLGSHNAQFCPLLSHTMFDCQQVITSSIFPLQDSLSHRSNVTCTLSYPTMSTDQEMTRYKLCTGGWDNLQLGLTTLGRVYLLVYVPLLLLQAGDVERNPGPTPGK